MTIGAQDKVGRISRGRVLDWPENALRGYLADIRKPPYRFDKTSIEGWKQHIDRLAAAKCNYIVLEQSLTFQYSFPGEPVGLPGGLRIDTARALSDYAHGQGIMLVPVVELSRGDSLRQYMERRVSRHPWMSDHQNAGFCPFNERSYEFIDRMIAELAAGFVHSPYLHVGEDETGGIGGSDMCPRCRRAVARYAVESSLAPDPVGYPMSYFQTRVSEVARRHGLQTMVWGTFGFLRDAADILEVVPKVMSKDVIIWDWRERGFAKVGYQVWEPYIPSWEWKGPGVREFITHMVALANKPAWDARESGSKASREVFSRSWTLTTFGVDAPEVGRKCLSIFGRNPYGYALDGDELGDLSRGRWLRLRHGGYLCTRPEEFRDPRRRHHPLKAIDDQIQRLVEVAAIFDKLSQQAPLNQRLAEWYARGVWLSIYGLQYVQSLQRAHQALQDATAELPDARRSQLVDHALRELRSILQRLDGPISATVQLSQIEIGGPVLNGPDYLEFDVTGVQNGVRAGVTALIQRVGKLSPARPTGRPELLGLFPSAEDA